MDKVRGRQAQLVLVFELVAEIEALATLLGADPATPTTITTAANRTLRRLSRIAVETMADTLAESTTRR